MTFPDWLKHGLAALAETGNLISLSVLGTASFLTWDAGLLLVGVAAEAAYLLVTVLLCGRRPAPARPAGESAPKPPASIADRHRRRIHLRVRCYRMRKQLGVLFPGGGEKCVLDRVLLVVTVAGFVGIMFFGFGKHLLSHRWYDLTHAEGWEAGAIWWTFLFLVYYIVKFRATGNVAVDKIIFGGLLVANGVFMWQALKSMEHPLVHVLYVLGIALCFLITDVLSAVFHADEKEKTLSRASLYWADLPMVFSFVILLVYLWWHHDTEAPEVFVSGVVACQLLISNAIFVVMEFGLLRPADR